MKIKSFLLLLFVNIMALSAQEKLELYFDFSKEVINEKSSKEFEKWLKNGKDKEVVKIHGFCDSVDSNLYNKELSKRRIDNVLSLLNSNQVLINEKLELVSYGEDFLHSKTQSENRKVEIFFKTVKPLTTIKEDSKKTIIEKIVDDSKPGDLLKLENINFFDSSDILLPESRPALFDLLALLIKNKNLTIEIQGHICCQPKEAIDIISAARAKKIYDILIKNGIEKERLSHIGFGSSKPIYLVPERNEKERIANRRVEIKILKK
ncbi:OmpA family protein [Flavobacterium sp. XN-5]|uniref:OmpA family protein n=1 Tax=Flavobacterium sp. XN-5 TaxID=2599390 RepID=UPI0011CA5D9C|nr:OmpA family protein [Flavobacterium sp. XN-5]NGY38407.1 OmpA family protein [Flavobacterium sp. XN-5]